MGALKIALRKKKIREVLEGHLKINKMNAEMNHESESWRMFLQKEDAVRSAHNVYSSINDSEECKYKDHLLILITSTLFFFTFVSKLFLFEMVVSK